MIIGTQEEAEWDDMYEYVANNIMPDYGFTPDGEFPYSNIEKGLLDIDMIFDVPEDTKFFSIEGGTVTNSIPAFAKAVMKDGNLIETTGYACHSSDPTKGENAILNLFDKLKKAEKNDPLIDILEIIRFAFEDCYGSNLPIYNENEYYNGEWIHRNVFAPTLIRTENGKIYVTVDVRFVYGTNPDDIVSCLDKLASSKGGRAEQIDFLPAIYVSRDKPFLKVFEDVYEKHGGVAYENSIAMGASYAKTMPNFVSWGPIFPDEEDLCHEPNESISIDTLNFCMNVYTDAIETIVFSDKSFK